MKYLGLFIGILLLVGMASAVNITYASHYPPAYNVTYANATSAYSNAFLAWNATNPGFVVTGAWGYNCWLAAINNSQRFNIDLGTVHNINRIYYENGHTSGTYSNSSVKDVTLWGSNSPDAFANRTYSNNTGWTQITLSDTHFEQHVAADTADPQYLLATNNTAWYRYYSLKIDNNYGSPIYLSLRRIELQSEVSWEYKEAGTYTWRAPGNMTSVTADLIGGGSSGMGGYAGTGSCGGGGGGYAGERETNFLVPVIPLQNYTVVVGTGGANASGYAYGNVGGYSSALGLMAAGGISQTVGSTGTWCNTGGNGQNGFVDLLRRALNGTQGYSGDSPNFGYGGLGVGAGGGGGGRYYSGSGPGIGGYGAPGYVGFFEWGYFPGNLPDFTGTPNTTAAGSMVQFIDESYITNTTDLAYRWDFGDGGTSNTTGNVSHIYLYPGVYTPSLRIEWLGSNNTMTNATTTKENYIVITSAPTIAWYSPNQVRFTVLDYIGNNVVGATVNATFVSSTMPDAQAWLQSIYGVDSTIAATMLSNNTVMQGTTGSDGAVVFTMHSSLQYNITATNGSTIISTLLYPKEADYNIWLPPPTVENLYERVNATLRITEPNASYITMVAIYQDHAGSTSSLLFYVNASNNTPVYSTTVSPGTANTTLNYTLPNVRGESYYYGIRGTRPGGNVSMDQGITGKGPSGVLVDLRLPATTYYPWIALIVLFLVTSLASKNNIKFFALLMPILAAIFWWFGWMNGVYLASVIPFACILGAIYYMKGSLRENYGVGGSGSLLLNIVVFLIIFQMMIGFINGLGVFNQSAMMDPHNQFTNLEQTEIREDVENFGGINDPIQSANSFAAIGWATIKIALQMLSAVFIVGYYLIEMFPYIPPEFFVMLQVGIYCLYVFFILKLVGKSGTESDF